jgi:Bacterial regulatory proteins, lacI family
VTRRLADIAQHVGVSQATVSRVLNDKPGIFQATRDAVLTALDVLGYERPNKLRGERARLVGIVLPEMTNPVFPALAEATAGALAKRGFSPVLCTRTVDGVSEADYVSILLEQQVSGVLFGGGRYQEADAVHTHYAALRERSLPTVLVNAAVEGLGFPQVCTDDGHGVDMAYGHLAALGHDRIGRPRRPRAVGAQAGRVPRGPRPARPIRRRHCRPGAVRDGRGAGRGRAAHRRGCGRPDLRERRDGHRSRAPVRPRGARRHLDHRVRRFARSWRAPTLR